MPGQNALENLQHLVTSLNHCLCPLLDVPKVSIIHPHNLFLILAFILLILFSFFIPTLWCTHPDDLLILFSLVLLVILIVFVLVPPIFSAIFSFFV